jgi:predicted nucleic acid-binding protein
VSDGLLDTNVVIHSMMNDPHADECREFLASLEEGSRNAQLEPYVVHEISYVLARLLRFSKDDIVSMLLRIVQWPGIQCDKDLLNRALLRWRDRAGLSFVDALLASQAELSQTRIFTINVKDFEDVGVEVPKPLRNYSPD